MKGHAAPNQEHDTYNAQEGQSRLNMELVHYEVVVVPPWNLHASSSRPKDRACVPVEHLRIQPETTPQKHTHLRLSERSLTQC